MGYYRSYASREEPPFVDCNRTRNGWECIGPRGRVWAEKKSDAIDEYTSRPGPFLFPAPIFIPPLIGPTILPPPVLGRPWIRGGRRYWNDNNNDVDIDVKNIYNIKAPDTVPTSGGRDVAPPVDPTPDPAPAPTKASGSFSMSGMPSWLLPVGAVGLILILVLVMKK